MKIGPFELESRILLAPMAGVTDSPFRQLCRHFGAGLASTEMVTADTRLWNTHKTRHRLDHGGEDEPRSVQVAGAEPGMLAEAAKRNVDMGAQIIDINMGCPAKKVCKRLAGSALLRDEQLVGRILEAVVGAVSVPVTLKTRTGWDPQNRNGVRIARIAEEAGIQALSVHGRTRACMYCGEAEYDTIRDIKDAVNIPVIANGDIDSAQKAIAVLNATGADGLMIGRAAQGQPWIFQHIDHFLATGEEKSPPPIVAVRDIMIHHLENLYAFYGEHTGVRVARKHLGWYCKGKRGAEQYRRMAVRTECAQEQLKLTKEFFDFLALDVNFGESKAA